LRTNIRIPLTGKRRRSHKAEEETKGEYIGESNHFSLSLYCKAMEKAVADDDGARPSDSTAGPLVATTSNNINSDEGHRKKKKVSFHDEVVFDDERVVVVSRMIDEGEFSSVFVARDSRSCASTPGTKKKEKKNRAPTPTLYALKRIRYAKHAHHNGYGGVIGRDDVEREAQVHRNLCHHDNIMPLLGLKFSEETCTAYMLFPYIPLSLRADITARRLLHDCLESKRRPYSEKDALSVFAGIVRAVQALHTETGRAHRDLKPENVMLWKKPSSSSSVESKKKKLKNNATKTTSDVTPVLTDFGSIAPLSVPVHSYADVLHVQEDVEKQTTAAYTAPELRAGYLKFGPSASLDYGSADVWSLGCLLFAMLYGSSPFEMEWTVSLVEGKAAEGTARIVDCTLSKVSGAIPFPPAGSAADRRYGERVKNLMKWMLNKVPGERPTTTRIAGRLETMIEDRDEKGASLSQG